LRPYKIKVSSRYTIILLSVCFILSLVSHAFASQKWYQYYQNGEEYFKKGQWQRAINEFKAAVSLEFEEQKRKRTYGMHFTPYFPHRYMAECYFNLGDVENAKKEIDLSLAFQSSKQGEVLQRRLYSGEAPVAPEQTYISPAKPSEPTKAELEYEKELNQLLKEKESVEHKRVEEREKADKRIKELEEQLAREREKRKSSYQPTYGQLPAGALTYDPNMVSQVGSRLSIAVMKFSFSGGGRDISGDVLNELITNLYLMGGRFSIIEREKVEKIVEEQMRAQAGQIDEKTAVQAGKVIGVDAVLVGSIGISGDGSAKIWARLINTETGQLITAQDCFAASTALSDVGNACMELSIKIYNDLPLVEGYVINVEPGDMILLDLGAEKRMKPDMQCVIYREGEKIKHPITGEIVYVKKTYLGEAVFTQVQQTSAMAKVFLKEKNEKIEVGDRVVVK
jgi:tetratricopeptide (TPR) repeat protein